MSAPRLSFATKEQILTAYLRGDKLVAIAVQFGVDRSYPRILARRRKAEPRSPTGRPA